MLATANPDKARELAGLLEGFDVVLRPADLPDVEEDADTLEGNARLKAVAVIEATGELAVADDTGLEVDALGGRPGVYAARYAGPGATYADNVAKLLEELAGVPAGERTARFRTVALARFPDGREIVAEGFVDGIIAEAPAGEDGFGYDPVFVPAGGDGRTFAQMTRAEKAEVSHRGRALRALRAPRCCESADAQRDTDRSVSRAASSYVPHHRPGSCVGATHRWSYTPSSRIPSRWKACTAPAAKDIRATAMQPYGALRYWSGGPLSPLAEPVSVIRVPPSPTRRTLAK